MAEKSFNIDSFSLKSSWTYRTRTFDQNGYAHFSNPYASTASKKVTVDLSAIPSGSRVISASLTGQATYGSSQASCNGVSVNIDGTQNVTSWFTTLASTITIQFSFQYNNPQPPIVQQREPSSPTYSRTSYFQNLVLTVNYELPNSTGKLNKNSVAADGSTITLTITPTNNSYKHRVVWLLEGETSATNHTQDVTLAAGTLTNTWTIASSFIDAIPNAANKTASVTLYTIKGNETIGSVVYTFTVTVPTSVVPSVTLQSDTLTWTNPNNDMFSGQLVQGISTARLRLKKADVHAGTGSDVKSVVFSGWGGSKTATKGETYYYADLGTLTSGGYKTIKVVVTDNRNRTYQFDSSTISAHFFPVRTYKEPVIDGISVKRCSDANGNTLDDTGSYMRVLVDYTYWRINNENGTAQNSVTISATYKISGQSQTSTVTLTKPVEVQTGNVKNVGNGAKAVVAVSTDRAYDVTITLKDALNKSSTASGSILTAKYVLHFKNGGNAVGIGQAAGSTNSLTLHPNWTFNAYGGPVNEHSVYKGEIVADSSNHKDLDDYTEYGYYAIHSQSVPYISNIPVNSVAGTLIVMSACDDERGRTSTGIYWSAVQIFLTRNGTIYKRYMRTDDVAGQISVSSWGKLMSTDETYSIADTSGTLATSRGGTGIAVNDLNALKTSLGIALGAGSSITFPENTVFPGIKTNNNKTILITFNLGRPLLGNLTARIVGSGYLLTTSGKYNNDPVAISSMGTDRTITCNSSGVVNLSISGSFGGDNNTPVSLSTSENLTMSFTAAS